MPGYNGTVPGSVGSSTCDDRGFCNVPVNMPGKELDFLKKEMISLKVQLSEIKARIDYLKDIESTHSERSR